MIEQPKINVTKFLEAYQSQNTRKNYKTGLKQFFKTVYPESKEDLDIQALKYLEENRIYREDLIVFRESLKKMAPKTIHARLNSIKCFLEENEITIKKRFFKNLNGKDKEAISEEKVPTNEELRRIIEYLPVQGKAVSLVLSSSGMRLGEALKIKIKDLNRDVEPAEIKIRSGITKTGKKRITFISPEAKEAVEEWLKYRDQYVKRAINRTHKERRKVWEEKEDNLFPFSPDTFSDMWVNSLEKAELLERDSQTNRVTLRPHNLRKFFRRILGQLNQDVAEALIGHQSGLNRVYANFKNGDGEERLREVYIQAIPLLSVYGRSITVSHINEDTEKKILELTNKVNILTQSNSLLRDKILVLDSKTVTLEADLYRFMKKDQDEFDRMMKEYNQRNQ